jgi:hypothetical protein
VTVLLIKSQFQKLKIKTFDLQRSEGYIEDGRVFLVSFQDFTINPNIHFNFKWKEQGVALNKTTVTLHH